MQICRQEWTASLPDGAMPRTESLKDLVGGNSDGTSHDKIFRPSISWFSTFPLEPFMSRLEVNSMFSRSRLPELNLFGRRAWNLKFWQGEFFTGLPCDDRLLTLSHITVIKTHWDAKLVHCRPIQRIRLTSSKQKGRSPIFVPLISNTIRQHSSLLSQMQNWPIFTGIQCFSQADRPLRSARNLPSWSGEAGMSQQSLNGIILERENLMVFINRHFPNGLLQYFNEIDQ